MFEGKRYVYVKFEQCTLSKRWDAKTKTQQKRNKKCKLFIQFAAKFFDFIVIRSWNNESHIEQNLCDQQIEYEFRNIKRTHIENVAHRITFAISKLTWILRIPANLFCSFVECVCVCKCVYVCVCQFQNITNVFVLWPSFHRFGMEIVNFNLNWCRTVSHFVQFKFEMLLRCKWR